MRIFCHFAAGAPFEEIKVGTKMRLLHVFLVQSNKASFQYTFT
jgi:hypothetical protein